MALRGPRTSKQIALRSLSRNGEYGWHLSSGTSLRLPGALLPLTEAIPAILLTQWRGNSASTTALRPTDS